MARELEIRHCRVLVALADCGGIGAAARQLGLAQSTVSETLASLERIAQTAMTIRKAGSEAILTPAAEELVPRARAIIAASEAALAAISPMNRRQIRLGATESLSSYLLPQVLTAVRLAHPGIDIQVATGICDHLRALVHRGELDAAVTLERLPRDVAAHRHRARPLGNAKLTIVAGEPSPESMTTTAIAARRILLPDPEGAMNVLVCQWLASAGRELRLESAGSVDGVKRGVRSSDALGVLPAYSVAEEIASGLLFELRSNPPLPGVTIELTAGPRLFDDKALDLLIDMIKAQLRGQPTVVDASHRS